MGQIRPAAPLKVARGRALIKAKNRSNDTRQVPVIWPLIWANPTPRFTRFSSLHQMIQFFWQFKYTDKNFGALARIFNRFWQFCGKIYQFWGKKATFLNVSNRKFCMWCLKITPSFLARPTPNIPLFSIFALTDPYCFISGVGAGGCLFWAFGPSAFWSKQFGPCTKLIENPCYNIRVYITSSLDLCNTNNALPIAGFNI